MEGATKIVGVGGRGKLLYSKGQTWPKIEKRKALILLTKDKGNYSGLS